MNTPVIMGIMLIAIGAVSIVLGANAATAVRAHFVGEPTEDELKAATAIVALADYGGRVDSFLVDVPGGNVLPIARSYAKQYPGRTVYERYMRDGRKLAMQMKAEGKKIEMPELKVRDGWHIERKNGSAALVKDGDPSPLTEYLIVGGGRGEPMAMPTSQSK